MRIAHFASKDDDDVGAVKADQPISRFLVGLPSHIGDEGQVKKSPLEWQ